MHVSGELSDGKLPRSGLVQRVIKGGKNEEFKPCFDFTFDASAGTVTLGDCYEGVIYNKLKYNDTFGGLGTYSCEFKDGRIASIKTGFRGCTFYKGIPTALYEREDEAKLPPSKWSVIDESQQDHIQMKLSYIDYEKLSQSQGSSKQGTENPDYASKVVDCFFDDNGNLVRIEDADGTRCTEFGYVHVPSPAKCAPFCSALIMASSETGIRIISDEIADQVHPVSNYDL